MLTPSDWQFGLTRIYFGRVGPYDENISSTASTHSSATAIATDISAELFETIS
jgi:hypothetical protein